MRGNIIDFYGFKALEVKHKKCNDNSPAVIIFESINCFDENNIELDSSQLRNGLIYDSLLNLCYTVIKTIKSPVKFIYIPTINKIKVDNFLKSDKFKNPLIKGVMFCGSYLCFNYSKPFSENIGCFFSIRDKLAIVSPHLRGPLGAFVKGQGGPAILGFPLKFLVQLASKPFFDLYPIVKPNITLIDTIAKFKKFYSKLVEKSIVSIDTETSGLRRVSVNLFTVQFAFSNSEAYCLPIEGHYECPWNPEEIKYIKKRMHNYFSTTRSLHIMQASAFDIGQLKHHFNVRFYTADIYDTIGGEFCFHEDTNIFTDKGLINIREVVKNPYLYKVKSYNHLNNEVEYKDIINTSEHTTYDDMYELESSNGVKIKVTENHKVWSKTRNSYVKVKDLLLGEELIIK